ncbi:hypothetical protein ACFVFQ_01915 [Streptomyces sp. NPDC057743]|uniref:hypothetical protein n=1 Tax=Streptomyces sp. NPDC057743 TaxID=3346236 RepID=UPI003683BAE0
MASVSCEAHPAPPRRIVVLGSPGSGKTTFCHHLAAATGLPLYHLDDLYWSANWSRPSEEEWTRLIGDLCALPRWIADGNYAASAEPRTRAADLVVLFDRHPLLCATALIRRSLRLRRTGPGPTPPARGAPRASLAVARHGQRQRTPSPREYVPRGLRDTGTPPVRSLTALLRKALLFRRRDLVVIRTALRRTHAPVRRCRTRRQAAALLTTLAPSQDRSAPPPERPPPDGTGPAFLPCTCPAAAPATPPWRST